MLIVIGAVLLALASIRLAVVYMRGREPSRGRDLQVDGDVVNVGIDRQKGSIRRVHIGIALTKDLSFSLYREGWFDRVAKFFGIARELQTGDVPFDGRIYVESEDPALHRALKSNRELRNALFNLMREPSTREVSAAKGRLWAVSGAYNGRWESDDDLVARKVANDFLPAFRAARPQLEQVKGGETPDARDSTRVVRHRISVAILACVLGGILGLFYAWLRFDHQVVQVAIRDLATLATIVTFLAFLCVVWMSLGATAFTHRVLLDVLLAAVPGAWFAAFGASLCVNETFDRAVARNVTTPIVLVWQSASRKNRRWYLAVARWPDARADRTVEVTRDEYTFLVTRRCVDVVWHDGRLGDGWVERYVASASPTCEQGVEK